MFLFSKIASILLLLQTINLSMVQDSTTFIHPLKIPIILSSNFGEVRSDHIHSGIDIKTKGTTGYRVYASADGYVYRIGVLPNGFGKTLYIRHNSGLSTVYAHLDSFSPEIERYVKDRQYALKSFRVDLFPPSSMFVFQQGDTIAYSGNSGSSGGPHLHFEVRESSTEKPINPLHYDIGATDSRPPIISSLVVYPTGKNSFVNGVNKKKTMRVEEGNGSYHLSHDSPITASGNIGFGIRAYDLLNDASNRCGVYSLELIIDGDTKYKNVFDSFAFSETKYVNSHIDYESAIKDNIIIQKTFILPNDKLSTYDIAKDRGLFTFDDGAEHDVRIVVADVHGNSSSLSFSVKSDTTSVVAEPEPSGNAVIMPYGTSNTFRSEGVFVSIPSNALYDTLLFAYEREEGRLGMYSDIHHIHNIYTPLHKAYTLSIKPTIIPEGKESKMVVVKLNDNKSRTAFSSSITKERFVSAQLSTFGNYYIDIDTVAPKINPLKQISNVDISNAKEIRFRITDDLSGIKSYDGFIDDKWALFEYDQKNNVLIYKFDAERITKSTTHKLELRVVDLVGNVSTYSASFRW